MCRGLLEGIYQVGGGGNPGNAPSWHHHFCQCENIYRNQYPRAPQPTPHWLPQSSTTSALFRVARHINFQQHFRAKMEQLKTFKRLSPESQGQNQDSTVLYVPYSADSGLLTPPPRCDCRMALRHIQDYKTKCWDSNHVPAYGF